MGYPLKRCVQAASLLAALVLLTTAAAPQTGSEGLSPTLANIKNAHVVRLGYRESSPPFSFLDQANRPIGYSLELCEAIVDEIGVEVDDANLKIEYVKVTSDDRIPAVVQNKIDLECRFEGQDGGGDKRHHQRAGDACCRQEICAWPQHHYLARS